MIITFQLFYNNNIIDQNINVKHQDVFNIKKHLKHIYNCENIEVFQNNILLFDGFNKWNIHNDYFIYIDSNNIYYKSNIFYKHLT